MTQPIKYVVLKGTPKAEISECSQEVFGNRFGTVKAIVCSCGFATTYSVLSNDADSLGREHFDRMHEAYRRGKEAQ